MFGNRTFWKKGRIHHLDNYYSTKKNSASNQIAYWPFVLLYTNDDISMDYVTNQKVQYYLGVLYLMTKQ